MQQKLCRLPVSGSIFFIVTKGENLQPRILYPARFSFRFNRETESFTNRKNLREFSITKPGSQQMLKELFQVDKKRTQLQTRKL